MLSIRGACVLSRDFPRCGSRSIRTERGSAPGRFYRLIRAVLPFRVTAPSTLGSFLRAFTFGHVRQLDDDPVGALGQRRFDASVEFHTAVDVPAALAARGVDLHRPKTRPGSRPTP